MSINQPPVFAVFLSKKSTILTVIFTTYIMLSWEVFMPMKKHVKIYAVLGIVIVGLVVSLVCMGVHFNKYCRELEDSIATLEGDKQQTAQQVDLLNRELANFRDSVDQFELNMALLNEDSSIYSYSQMALSNGLTGSENTTDASDISTVWAALNVIKWAYSDNSLTNRFVSQSDLDSVINGVNNIVSALERYPDLWPTDGGWVTSYFGYRSDPFTSEVKYHSGVDIAVNYGTNVYASGAGTVYATGYDEAGYGYYVMVDHGNGYVSLYGHLSKINVSTGQKVSKGQVIALSGNSGRSTGPHLHAELRQNGVRVSPKFDY